MWGTLLEYSLAFAGDGVEVAAVGLLVVLLFGCICHVTVLLVVVMLRLGHSPIVVPAGSLLFAIPGLAVRFRVDFHITLVDLHLHTVIALRIAFVFLPYDR